MILQKEGQYWSLTVDATHVEPTVRPGVFTYVVKNHFTDGLLQALHGRENACLKVFKRPAQPLDEFCWSDSNGVLLTNCVLAQNLLAKEGLAPRVYDLLQVNGAWAMVTEFVTGEYKDFDRDRFEAAKAKYHIDCRIDPNYKNYPGGLIVDFQSYHIADLTAYTTSLVERAYKYAAWGSRSEPYQVVLDQAGQRDFEHRLEIMQLKRQDFTDKDVLDIGCNLGNMVRYSLQRGARKAVGVDLPQVAALAYEVANLERFWNADFFGLRLPAAKDKLPKSDIVFALSVDAQIGYDSWMADLTREVFYLEGHVPQREETFRHRLEEDFEIAEYLGMTRDHGPRPIFRARKE